METGYAKLHCDITSDIANRHRLCCERDIYVQDHATRDIEVEAWGHLSRVYEVNETWL